MSGAGGHAAGGCDEMRPMLLSLGPVLEKYTNMQHDDDDDDDSQLQRLDWLTESQTGQSKPEELVRVVWA